MIDCFTFLNELDLLEIRLNSLDPYVSEFVLIESPLTFSGKAKPLFYMENKNRFKDFNVRHLIYHPPEKLKGWGMYWDALNFMVDSLNVDPDEMVLISDIDEIPNLIDWDGREGIFKQKKYYYYLDGFTGKDNWKGTDAVKRKNIKSVQALRAHRFYDRSWKNGGWHFCSLGPIEQVLYKFDSFAHREGATPEGRERIRENMKGLIDPYDGLWKHPCALRVSIEMPDGPDWLLANKDRYKHLFYGG